MPFARRDARSKAIAGFWHWWPGARGRIEAAINSGEWGDLPDEVGNRIAAIHPDLQWEFTRGGTASHALIVTAAGVPELRAAAARWHAAAPAADRTWEYHRTRQPDPAFRTVMLNLAGHEIRLQDTRFAFLLDPDRCEIDVVCHHPVFAEAPEEVQRQVPFLVLDWLLGEEAVELWIGGVAPQRTLPDDALPPQALAEQVAQLAAEYAKPVWALVTARDREGYPMLATIVRPLKSARWPRFDTHLAICLPYQQNSTGLPTDDALRELRAFEDRLTATLGSDGELVAHESHRGRRTLHVYADDESAIPQLVQRAAATWPGRNATVSRERDPAFTAVAHLRP
ncbi:MAG: DUF695 domain-containing protein [Micromonosporaceae bacterium]|nr:DUF695 domain-containing protein [Micromonosporaceae bacterium]